MSQKVGKIEDLSGFYATINALYRHVRTEFEFPFPHEQELGVKPLRLDMLLIRRRYRKKLGDDCGPEELRAGRRTGLPRDLLCHRTPGRTHSDRRDSPAAPGRIQGAQDTGKGREAGRHRQVYGGGL